MSKKISSDTYPFAANVLPYLSKKNSHCYLIQTGLIIHKFRFLKFNSLVTRRNNHNQSESLCSAKIGKNIRISAFILPVLNVFGLDNIRF